MSRLLKNILLGVSLLFPVFSWASVQWRATLVLPDREEKTYELSSKELKFYLPKSKWSCWVSTEIEDWSNVGGKKIKRFLRSLKCKDLRAGDEFWVSVKCFDLEDQLEAHTLKLLDERKQEFTLHLSCSSL